MNIGPGPGSQGSLRRANRERLMEVLLEGGPRTQAQLARATALAPSTVSNLVHELIEEGLLEVDPGEGGGRSRRVRPALGTGVVIGLDLGRFHLAGALANVGRTLLAEERQETPGFRSLDQSLESIDTMVDRLLEEAAMDRAAVRGAALALPAPIDSRTGRIASAAILPAWQDVDPVAVCEARLGFPVSVHNDTNLGALGEVTWGAGVGVSHLAYVWISEGVGSGLVLDGRPYSGVGGIAGEIGHTAHRSDLGDLCRCGNRGCLETIVSTRAVVRLLEPQVGPLDSFDHVVELAQSGNVLCSRVLAETGRRVGVAVADLINLVDPQRVVIGGELAHAGDLAIDGIKQMVRQYSIQSAADTVEIVPAELGVRAEVLGAVAAALHNLTFKK